MRLVNLQLSSLRKNVESKVDYKPWQITKLDYY